MMSECAYVRDDGKGFTARNKGELKKIIITLYLLLCLIGYVSHYMVGAAKFIGVLFNTNELKAPCFSVFGVDYVK